MTKHIRIAFLALATISASVAPLLAQDGPPPPPPAGQQGGQRGGNSAEMQAKRLEGMTKDLNLTSDQVTAIKAIQADGMQKMQALRADAATTGPDRRAKMMAIRADENTKVKALLTAEQKVGFDAMQERMRDRHRPEGAPPTPPSN